MQLLSFSQATALAASLLAVPCAASSFWTVNCFPLTRYRADPILNPGVASGHVHDIVGGTAFRRNMSDPNIAMAAKNTTCDKYTDHSNYWVPSLYYIPGNGSLTLMKFTGMASYYKNYTCDYNSTYTNGCPGDLVRQARAYPPGFRMVVGDSTRRTADPNARTDGFPISFSTKGADRVVAMPNYTGGNFELNVQFPSCWNGRDLWLPGSAHVAYPAVGKGDIYGGVCPSTHPLALISIGAIFFWYTDPDSVDTSKNNTQLVFANGDTTGYGAHGDFLQGWSNQTALQQSFANCFDNGYCPWRAFGTPDGKDAQQNYFNPEVAPIYEEPIGLNGPISFLPGNRTTNCVYSCKKSAPYCCDQTQK